MSQLEVKIFPGVVDLFVYSRDLFGEFGLIFRAVLLVLQSAL